MAKLRVSPEFLVSALFQGARPDVEIVGAQFDTFGRLLLLDIRGDGIPAEGQVNAVCRQERFTVEFQPVPGLSTAQPPKGP